MFRENYKNAMDDVETNKELLNSLLKKADAVNIPAVKKNKIFLKSRIYAFSGVAAAAAIAIVSFNALTTSEHIKKGGQEGIGGYEITEETNGNTVYTSETIYEPPKETQKALLNESVSEKNTEEIRKEPGTQTVKEPQQEATVFSPTADTIVAPMEEMAVVPKTETISENAPAMASVDSYALESDISEAEKNVLTDESEENLPSSSARASGGGSLASKYVNDSIETQEWTKEEYYSYIGINIEKSVQLPGDMENFTENTVYIVKDKNSNEIKNDYFNFYFRGENERYVSISTEKTASEDTAWEITASDNDYVSASAVNGGTLISVECYMLTETERNALMISLSK